MNKKQTLTEMMFSHQNPEEYGEKYQDHLFFDLSSTFLEQDDEIAPL